MEVKGKRDSQQILHKNSYNCPDPAKKNTVYKTKNDNMLILLNMSISDKII